MIKKKDLLKRIACISSAVVVTLSAVAFSINAADGVTANAYSNLTGPGQPIFGLGNDYIIQMYSGISFMSETLDDELALQEGLGHANISALMTISDGDSLNFTMAVQLTNDYNVYANPSACNVLYVNYLSDTGHLRILRPYLFYWNGYNPSFVVGDCSVYITGYTQSSPLGSFFNFYYSADSTNPNTPNPFGIHTNLAEAYYDEYYNYGYAMGFQTGETTGYDNGYAEGFAEGDLSGYNTGYNTGSVEGYNEGYEDGERVGYNNGLTVGYGQAVSEGDFSWNSFFSAFIDVPINAFTSLLNFEILGVNLAGFFGGLLTVCLIIVIMKFIL